jgi:hypothetical protein
MEVRRVFRYLAAAFALILATGCSEDEPSGPEEGLPAAGSSAGQRMGGAGGQGGLALGGSSPGGTGGRADTGPVVMHCQSFCTLKGMVCAQYDTATCRTSCEPTVLGEAADGCLVEYDAMVTCLGALQPSNFMCLQGNNPVQMSGLCPQEITAYEDCFERT